jgi:hypothetical protein
MKPMQGPLVPNVSAVQAFSSARPSCRPCPAAVALLAHRVSVPNLFRSAPFSNAAQDVAEAFCRILGVSSLEGVSVRDLPRDQLMAVGLFLSNRSCLNHRNPLQLSGQAAINVNQVDRLMEEITQEALRDPRLLRLLDPIYVFANAVGKDVEGQHSAADTAVLPLCPQPRNSKGRGWHWR